MTQEPERSRASEPDPADLGLRDYAVLLVVPLIITLVGNVVGPDIPILEALPGAFVLYGIVVVGLMISRYAPLRLPDIAWVITVGALVTIPWTPGSGWVVEQVESVDFLATTTPVLAYAGLSLSRDQVGALRGAGWKIVVVTILAFIGTYIGSAIIAHIVLML